VVLLETSLQAPSSQQLSALAIVLDMPELAADPLLLCSAAKVCRSWRAAVTDSGAGTTNVLLFFDEHLPSSIPGIRNRAFSRLCSFTDWMRRHAHLVGSIKLEGFTSASSETALHLCSMLSTGFWERGRPLHLQRFESDVTDSESTWYMLKALPDSLIELDVVAQDYLSCREMDWGMAEGALARLTSLKTLTIRTDSYSTGCEMHPDTLAGLTGLTCLDLGTDVSKVCSSQLGSRLDAIRCSMRHAWAKGNVLHKSFASMLRYPAASAVTTQQK